MSNINEMSAKTDPMKNNYRPGYLHTTHSKESGVLRTMFLTTVSIARGMPSHRSNFTFSPKCCNRLRMKHAQPQNRVAPFCILAYCPTERPCQLRSGGLAYCQLARGFGQHQVEQKPRTCVSRSGFFLWGFSST